MRYSTVPAINFEAHVARNREIIMNLKTIEVVRSVWCPESLSYVNIVVQETVK